MALYGEPTKAFELCPEGHQSAVLVEITEKTKESGAVKWLWKFETDDVFREDGEPFYLYKETYRSGPYVREMVDRMADRTITDEEWTKFDVQQLEGEQYGVNVVHNEHNGKTYANVDGVSRYDPFAHED